MNDIESRLRATLNEHAAHAPVGDELADRILTEVEAPARVLRPRRGWTTWTMPLLAAGAVAAVVAGVVGVGHLRHTAAPQPPALSHHVPSPSPTLSPTPSPSPLPTTPSSQAVAAPNPAAVTGFHALDLTFVSDDEGWALGSADCVTDPGSTCTALFHTTNGSTWTSMPGAAFNVPGVKQCATPCVDHIRFANQDIGYAYGSDTLFMTLDGGYHWTEQPGLGADVLETLDGNVILARVVDAPSLLFERAPIGSSQWTAFTVPNWHSAAVLVGLARSGHTALLESVPFNVARGNGLNQSATLYRSSDDGSTWTKIGEPCPSVGAGYTDVSAALAMAGDGTTVVDCAVRSLTDDSLLAGHTITSTDGGRTFSSPPAGGKLPPAQLLATASRDVQLLVAGNKLYRSADGGNSWTRVRAVTGNDVSFIGFESSMVGRAVTDGGRKVWTTRDAGRTWTPFDFS